MSVIRYSKKTLKNGKTIRLLAEGHNEKGEFIIDDIWYNADDLTNIGTVEFTGDKE